MTKIDWSGELEAYYEDGRVVPAKCFGLSETGEQCVRIELIDGNFRMMRASLDGYIGSGWRIRNRQPANNDRLARLEAFVARMANSVLEFGFYDEAKALVAEIAPVDSDLIEARKLVGDLFPGSRNIYEKGEWDCEPTVQTVLTAIKRGRALERGEP